MNEVTTATANATFAVQQPKVLSMVVLPMLSLKEIQELENKNLAYGWRNMSFVRI